MAEQTGIPLQTFKGYELGHRQPGADALTAIAKTGVNVNWLLTGEGEMRTPQAAAGPAGVAAPASADQVEPLGDMQPYGRRLAALAGMLANLPEREAGALIDEFAARAATQQQMTELRLAVEQLRTQAKRA